MHTYGGIRGSAAAYGLSEEERNKEGLKGEVVGLIFVTSYMIPGQKTCSTCDADMEHPPMVGFNMEEVVGTCFSYMRFGHGVSRSRGKSNNLDKLGLSTSANVRWSTASLNVWEAELIVLTSRRKIVHYRLKALSITSMMTCPPRMRKLGH